MSCRATPAPKSNTDVSRICFDANVLPVATPRGSGSTFFTTTPRTIAITSASITARSKMDFSNSATSHEIRPSTKQTNSPKEFFSIHESFFTVVFMLWIESVLVPTTIAIAEKN